MLNLSLLEAAHLLKEADNEYAILLNIYQRKTGSKSVIAYDIIRDMKSVLNKTVYDKLIENSFHYAPPYLPVYGFMKEIKKWPALCLTRKEWDPAETKKAFKEFVIANYPNMDADEVIEQIDHYPD